MPNMKIGKLRIHISPHQSEIHGQEGDLNPGLLSESLCISMKYDHICSVCSFLTIMKVAHLKCHSKLIFQAFFAHQQLVDDGELSLHNKVYVSKYYMCLESSIQSLCAQSLVRFGLGLKELLSV